MTWLLIMVTVTGLTAIHTTEAQCKAAVPLLTSKSTISWCIAPNGEVHAAQRGRPA